MRTGPLQFEREGSSVKVSFTLDPNESDRLRNFLSDETEDSVSRTLVIDCGLPTRTTNALHAAGIRTLGDLATWTDNRLSCLSGIGKGAMIEIRELCKGVGIELRKNGR